MFTFNSIPLVKLLVPLCLGIVSASYFPFYNKWLIYFTVGALFLSIGLGYYRNLFRRFRHRYIYGLILFVVLYLVGYILPQQKNPAQDLHFFGSYLKGQDYDSLLVTVVEAPQEKNQSYKWNVRIDGVYKGGEWIETSGNALLYAEKKSKTRNIQYGDQLFISAQLEEVPPPANPNEFNYKRYLRHHYIFHRAYIRSEAFEKVAEHKAHTLIEFALSTRSQLLEILRFYGFSGDEYAVLSALILGFKDHLDFEITQAFSSAGAMHVLAVSGLHVGIILLLVSLLLKPLRRHAILKYVKLLVELLAVWGFAILTGLSPSVIRAATMFSFIAVGKTLDRNTNIYNTLAVSAFFILLIEPYMLMEVGFQLSFLAVLGILLIQPKIYQLIQINNRLLDWVWTITTVSIAAQIATAPLGLLYFHQFPNYFIFSNLIVIPSAFVLVIGGVALFLTSSLEWLAEPIALLLNTAVSLLNRFVKITEHLPYSISSQIDLSTPETWLIYFCISCILVFIYFKRKQFFIYALGGWVIFTFVQLLENRSLENQRLLTVYSTKRTTAVDYINGNQHLFVGHAALLNDPSSLQFNIWHHWWANDLTERHTVEIDTLGTVSIIETPTVPLVIIKSGSVDWKSIPPNGFWVISERAMVPTEKKIGPIKCVILDGSLHWKKRRKWIKWCQGNQLNFWDVKKRGAYVTPLVP